MARWALISAEHGTESETCVRQVVTHLENQGVRVGGFVQRKHVNEDDTKRYELVRLRGHDAVVLAEDNGVTKSATDGSSCTWVFHDHGFAVAKQWVEEDMSAVDVVVLGGVSKLERAGKGHSATVKLALGQPDKIVLLLARASQLFDVVEHFGLEEEDMIAALELPADRVAHDVFLADLMRGCLGRRSHQ